MNGRVKKKTFPGEIDLFESRWRLPFLQSTAQLSDKQPGLSPHDVYRRGPTGDAPLIAKLGGHGVGRRPDQSAKTLCLNSKHRAREALDKFLERVRR